MTTENPEILELREISNLELYFVCVFLWADSCLHHDL